MVIMVMMLSQQQHFSLTLQSLSLTGKKLKSGKIKDGMITKDVRGVTIKLLSLQAKQRFGLVLQRHLVEPLLHHLVLAR